MARYDDRAPHFPTVSGSPNVVRQDQFDALGRLQSVCGVTTLAGYSSCGQTVAQNGYLTSYLRNGRGQIVEVAQGAQQRSFDFDELGRMVEQIAPETGTTRYYYGASPACTTQTGAMAERLDNAGNIACYAHDTLGRVTTINYTAASGFAPTPAKTFVYDAGTVAGVQVSNPLGHLVEAYTGSSARLRQRNCSVTDRSATRPTPPSRWPGVRGSAPVRATTPTVWSQASRRRAHPSSPMVLTARAAPPRSAPAQARTR